MIPLLIGDDEAIQLDLNYMTKEQFCAKYKLRYNQYEWLRYGFNLGAMVAGEEVA